MQFDILTIFPEIFDSYFSHSLMARALKKKLIRLKVHDLRKYARDRHRTVDDKPYGGGVGMVMKVDVVAKALKAIKKKKRTRVILMTPQGKPFAQKEAKRLKQYYDRLILISGRYEGYDERIRSLADEEMSIGDYILTGGELPAAVVVDAVARLVPGVVGKEQSIKDESFSESANWRTLEYPQYTRPPEFQGKKVPKVLLSGNHEEIKKWRQQEAFRRTKKRRPDLLKK